MTRHKFVKNIFIYNHMALPISAVPVLTGKAADRFSKQMKLSEHKRGTINFSKEISEARKILFKARISYLPL